MKNALATLIGCLLSLSCFGQSLDAQKLEQFASQTALHFGVVSNTGESGPSNRLMLDNQSDVALPPGAEDWRIYFHSVRKIEDTEADGLRVAHVQGDLHQLAPTEEFAGLKPGAQLQFRYRPASSQAAYTDFMPRAFIHRPGLEPVVFDNTDTEDMARFIEPFERTEQRLRSDQDQIATAGPESRFQENLAVNNTSVSESRLRERIIPRPLTLDSHWGETTLAGDWTIAYAGRLSSEAEYLAGRLEQVFGTEFARQPDHQPLEGPRIELRVDPEADNFPQEPESYRLTIDKGRIVVTGRDNAGAFYGLQSLMNLLPPKVDDQRAALPRLTITDKPRAGWRGMHYDMGRNFHGKGVTLRLIEQMGRYKLNKLHLHLTEDEGWRLEIPGLPELTEIGAQRCFDLEETDCLLTQLGTGPHPSGSGNGFYSRADFIEILEYAAARHIEVIPEIDMPGHARAAIKAMNARHARLTSEGKPDDAAQYLLSHPEDTSEYVTVQNYTDNSIDVCLESTYTFVDKVMYELQQMYREANLKLNIFHMGGDEVGQGSWTESPACKELMATREGVAGVADLKPYFVSRVAALAHERGLALAGWEDGLMYDANNPFNRKQFQSERILANAWDNIWEWGVADRAYLLANAGYEVILSHATHLYFDHPYEAHPEERGYYWATRSTDTRKVFSYMPDHLYANAETTREGEPIENLEAMVGRPLTALEKPENILGIQGQVWTETIRTAEQLEPMLYPRLLALAERAWHRADWEGRTPDSQARLSDYASFAQALAQRELPRLQAAGVDIYLAPPGGRWHENQLEVNTNLPGITVEVRQGKDSDWEAYSPSITRKASPVWLRARLGSETSRPTRLD